MAVLKRYGASKRYIALPGGGLFEKWIAPEAVALSVHILERKMVICVWQVG
jgi:hypothetical protein